MGRKPRPLECVAAAGLRSPPGLRGQVNKRARRMPWRQAAMKDVQACEKPGGDGKGRYHPGMSEWGNPVPRALPAPYGAGANRGK